jgi:hypothetical protein
MSGCETLAAKQGMAWRPAKTLTSRHKMPFGFDGRSHFAKWRIPSVKLTAAIRGMPVRA